MNEPLSDRQQFIERQWALSRRRFLRGLGACVALPTLPSLLPRLALASEAIASPGEAASAGEAALAAGAPRRMVFVTIPNGVNQQNWWPTGSGKEFDLSATMNPLAGIKEHIQVIGG